MYLSYKLWGEGDNAGATKNPVLIFNAELSPCTSGADGNVTLRTASANSVDSMELAEAVPNGSLGSSEKKIKIKHDSS